MEELRPRIERWFSQGAPNVEVEVESLHHASVGWTNETLLLRYSETGSSERAEKRAVIRLAADEPTFPDADLSRQAEVQRVVSAAGIPAPAPVTVETDEKWLGAPFMVMPHVDGHVPGEILPFDDWISSSSVATREQIQKSFVGALAALHRFDWRPSGVGELLRGADAHLSVEVDWWDRYVRWGSGGAPSVVVSDALEWCRRNVPETTHAPSLLWGDARLGNIIVDDGGRLRGVLDWEMASIGPAELDLGWYLALDWAMGELVGRRVEGFARGDQVVESYEALLGRATASLEWYEIFALMRSLAISDRQAVIAANAGVRYFSGSGDANPLAGLLERRLDSQRG